LDEAAALYEEALRGCRKVLGNREITTLISIGNLGMLLQKQGKPTKAAPLLEEVLQAKRALIGDYHQSTLTSMNNLGVLLANDLGKLNEAGPLLKEALRGRRTTLGDRHQETLTSVLSMAELLAEQGRLEEASALFEEELQACREMLGDGHQSTLRSIQNLAYLRQKQASVKCRPSCPRILAYSLAHPLTDSLTHSHVPPLTYPLITHSLTHTHSPTRFTYLKQGRCDEAAALHEEARALHPSLSEQPINNLDSSASRNDTGDGNSDLPCSQVANDSPLVGEPTAAASYSPRNSPPASYRSCEEWTSYEETEYGTEPPTPSRYQ
jgi:tetratricopeptide (TPR) repeat protein